MAPGLFDTAGTAVLAVAVSLAVHIALNSPIQPVMSPPRPANRYPPNGLLQRLEKLGEGRLSAPEDVYVDAAAGGTVYTATRDGWLQRMHPNGSWENWRFVGGSGLLGIAPSADGSMLVCDADKLDPLRVLEPPRSVVICRMSYKGSIARMKRKSERGSPWRNPFWYFIWFLGTLLSKILEDDVAKEIAITLSIDPKPLAYQGFSMYSKDTESKALAMSSLSITTSVRLLCNALTQFWTKRKLS